MMQSTRLHFTVQEQIKICASATLEVRDVSHFVQTEISQQIVGGYKILNGQGESFYSFSFLNEMLELSEPC